MRRTNWYGVMADRGCADYGAGYYVALVVDPDGYRLEAYCGRTGS